MRVVPERAPWLQIATVFGGLLIGPYAGFRVSRFLAPDSGLVETASILGLAFVFVAGMVLWMGLGVATVLVGFVWRIARRRRPGPGFLGRGDRLVPPGYRAFVVLGVISGILVGLIAGLVTELRVPAALGAWTVLGLGYGLLLWTAAHHGYLPFPEPE